MMVVVTNDDQWSKNMNMNMKKKQLPSQEHYMKSKYDEKRLRHWIR